MTSTRPWRRWVYMGLAVVLVIGLALTFMVGLVGLKPPVVLPWLVAAALGAAAAFFARAAIVQDRAHRQALLEAAAREAIIHDRLRIAADLHDVVSHGLGAITLRAHAGQALAARDPREANTASGDVIALSRAATDDLRAILSVLRDPDRPTPTHPALGLGDLPALARRARERGLDVELTTPEAHAVHLTPGAEMTAARVVAQSPQHGSPCRSHPREHCRHRPWGPRPRSGRG